jgi:hypothetical protein
MQMLRPNSTEGLVGPLVGMRQYTPRSKIDFEPHVGNVVTVEKTTKKGEKKEDDSTSSTLVLGIGVTQQLFATTGFLDAPDNKQEEDRKTDGFDNASLKSPNLWQTQMTNKMRPSLKETPPPWEPTQKRWRVRRRRGEVMRGRGHGGLPAPPVRSFSVYGTSMGNQQKRMTVFST